VHLYDEFFEDVHERRDAQDRAGNRQLAVGVDEREPEEPGAGVVSATR
jgi:hypothetical protein